MANILVVDDRATDRKFLVTLLNRQKHHLFEASDGAEALALVKSQRPDLVVTDILMPTMDGYEFVRQLRADPAVATTAVIFFTAHYHIQEARTGWELSEKLFPPVLGHILAVPVKHRRRCGCDADF